MVDFQALQALLKHRSGVPSSNRFPLRPVFVAGRDDVFEVGFILSSTR